MTSDFVDEKRREMESRLKELGPLVEEYNRLVKAVEALKGVDKTHPPASSSHDGSRRRRSGSGIRKASDGRRPGAGTGKRGRPKGSGTRDKQALELVKARPGITIPEIAEAMGIKQNYLYRVLPGLQQDGQVTKKGKGWYPKEAS